MKSYTWRHAIINSQLVGTTRHVLLTLSCHVNDAGEAAYPSVATLAAETALSERTVCTHLELAVKLGWLIKNKHGYAGQKWARNEYYPRVPDGFVIVAARERGTEIGSVPCASKKLSTKALKEVQCLDQGTERDSVPQPGKALNLTTEGTEPDDIKALKEVQSNYSKELPVNNSLSAAKAGRESERKIEEEKSRPRPFDRFWKIYPPKHKAAKVDCLVLWTDKGLDAHAEAILVHVEAMKTSEPWRKGFSPAPLKYLTGQRWQDGPPEVAPAARTELIAEWWTSADGTDARGGELGVRPRKPDEPLPHYRLHVAKAAGRGPWIDAVLREAEKISVEWYRQVIGFLGEGLMPTDFHA